MIRILNILLFLVATSLAQESGFLSSSPTLSVKTLGGDQLEITFPEGILQQSVDGLQTWQDVVPQPTSPYLFTKSQSRCFWRVVDLSVEAFPSDVVIMGLHGGQSNGVGEGDVDAFNSIRLSQATVNYQFGQLAAGASHFEPTSNAYGEYGQLRQSNGGAIPYGSIGADKWYAESMQRSFNVPFAIANFARGGTPTNQFYPPITAGNAGRFSPLVNATLLNTKTQLEADNPNKRIVFQFAYWDQVEFDGGNGGFINRTKAQFISARDRRAATIARLYDSLAGVNADPNRNFSVTNPDIILFIRDIGDGQWRIGGGGVALNADISDPDYIIKADPSRTFNGVDVNGIHVPYNSNAEGSSFHDATAEWNGWMAIRSAHQLLTDPSHGSVHYRPNIRLVDSDGVGTRADAAISGDGVHFGGRSMHTVADRFLTEYNKVFGTNLTIPSL